jgi:hypothetical protein
VREKLENDTQKPVPWTVSAMAKYKVVTSNISFKYDQSVNILWRRLVAFSFHNILTFFHSNRSNTWVIKQQRWTSCLGIPAYLRMKNKFIKDLFRGLHKNLLEDLLKDNLEGKVWNTSPDLQ